MKVLSIVILLVCTFLALGEEDGKYRPEVLTTAAAAVVPTTIRPVINRWNEPRWGQPGWNAAGANNWNNPAWNANPAWNTWNRPNATVPGRNDWRWNAGVGNRWDSTVGRPVNRFNDWRTHLEETADARGYQYDYETINGIKVLETGTFEHVGLRHEGVRAIGSITITDRDGVVYKINYQSESKEAYIPRGNREPERIPPTIARALLLLETHK